MQSGSANTIGVTLRRVARTSVPVTTATQRLNVNASGGCGPPTRHTAARGKRNETNCSLNSKAGHVPTAAGTSRRSQWTSITATH